MFSRRLFESRRSQNKTFIWDESLGISYKLEDKNAMVGINME